MTNSKGKMSSMTAMQPCCIAKRLCAQAVRWWPLICYRKGQNCICGPLCTENVEPWTVKVYFSLKIKPSHPLSCRHQSLAHGDRSSKSLSSFKSACCKSCSLQCRHVQPGQAPSLTSPDKNKSLGFLFPGLECHGTAVMRGVKKKKGTATNTCSFTSS